MAAEAASFVCRASRSQRKKRDRYRELEENRRSVQEQNDVARAAVNNRLQEQDDAAEQARMLQRVIQRNRDAALNRTWSRALRNLNSLLQAETVAEGPIGGTVTRCSSCPKYLKYNIPAPPINSDMLHPVEPAEEQPGGREDLIAEENTTQLMPSDSSCSRNDDRDLGVMAESLSQASRDDANSACMTAELNFQRSMDDGTVSECGSEASSTITADNSSTKDPLTVGQRVIISKSVVVVPLRGRVAKVVKASKRDKPYTLIVGHQKFKAARDLFEPAPSGEELRLLISDVMMEWLPATAGWEPHEDCSDTLMLDCVDAIRALETGQQPLPPTPEHCKPKENLAALLENEEGPMDAMDSIMAGAYLDLPNPLCNPWQRMWLWDLACPNAKVKYRTHLQKMMDSLEPSKTSSSASSSSESTAPSPIQSPKSNDDVEIVTPNEEAPHCVVCFADSTERSIDWIFKGCGHRCLCKPCVRKLHDNAASDTIECPLCRLPSKVVPLRNYNGRVFSAL